jgi:hypothetical protein
MRQIESVLLGQVEAIEALRAIPPEELNEAVQGKRLILKREAVVSVLDQFRRGEIGAIAAQQWASFVRRGHVEGLRSRGPIKPIEIDWELPYEDAISEAISRLDELGDLVDGEFRDGEAEELMAHLV